MNLTRIVDGSNTAGSKTHHWGVGLKSYTFFALVLIFAFSSSISTANSAVKVGDSCKTVGQKSSQNGATLTCVKSGSKLVWTSGSKSDSYDSAFANTFLAEAKKSAAQILADAKYAANQVSNPPNCSTSNSRAYVSIGSDASTGLRALVYENPGICELTVRASASFLCPDGKVQKMSNAVTSTGMFPLKANEKLLVSYNIQRYFPQVLTECRLLTGYSSNTVNIDTYHQGPSVMVLSSRFTGTFNQAEATKKADQILKSAKSRADKVIADGKNPTLIAAAWKSAKEFAAKAAAEAAAREIEEAPAKAAAEKAAAKVAADAAARAALDAGAGKTCVPEVNCPLGSIGPGKGIVFFDAGSRQPWGRYLEVAPLGWSGSAADPKIAWCDTTADGGFVEFLVDRAAQPVRSKLGREVGTGSSNTDLMLTKCTIGPAVLARAYRGGGKSDWFLPSADEFLELIKYQKQSGWFKKGYDTWHHTSTEWTYHNFLSFYIDTEFGGPFVDSKSSLRYVRPFRAF